MCIDIRLLRSLHLKNPTSLTRCEMICAEQSPMKRTDLGSAVLQSTLGDNCNEIHNKPENFSSHGYSPFICKKKNEICIGYFNQIKGKKNPKWRLEFTICYGIRCPFSQMRVQGDLVFMCLLTSRQVLHLYMTVYSIHSTARHANLSLSLAHPGRS